MTAAAPQYRGFIHAGAGTGLFLIQASALFPGLLASLAICALLLLPLLVLGLAAAVLAAPPYVVWRVASRARRRRA